MVQAKLAGHTRVVQLYRERLALLQRAWDNLALLSRMNRNGIDLQATRAAFGRLAGALLENLATESLRNTAQAMSAKAQIAIDVMVRNLYERTADSGFLSTDSNVRKYCCEPQRERSGNSAPSPLRP